MLKGMHKNSGFSLMELMVTIAIIAVLAAIAVPNMIGWRSNSQFRGAVENLRGDLQLAKLKAVQESVWVAVLFSDNGYQVFTDDGSTQTGAFHEADGERLFRNRQLPPGVSINIGDIDFHGNKYVRFNNRGLPDNDGYVVVNSSGDDLPKKIKLNRVGRVSIEIIQEP